MQCFPYPSVLLWLPSGMLYSELESYLLNQNIRLIRVASADSGKTLSYLLGLESARFGIPEQLPEEPVLVLFGLNGVATDQLLAFLRSHRPIALKASVTQANLKWTFAHLAKELAKEHKQLNQ